jgi:hypothetical protein
VGVDLVIFGFAAMDRLHGEGMPKHTRDTFIGAQIGEPVPGKHACDGDDETVSIRGNGCEKSRRVRFHVSVQHDVALLVEDADLHGLRVQVDAAVKWVLGGVESH